MTKTNPTARKSVKAWGIKDCLWHTIREVYWTKREALEYKHCDKCKIIRILITELKKES